MGSILQHFCTRTHYTTLKRNKRSKKILQSAEETYR